MSSPFRRQTARRGAPSRLSYARTSHLDESIRSESRVMRILRVSQGIDDRRGQAEKSQPEDDRAGWSQERLHIALSDTQEAVSQSAYHKEDQLSGWEAEDLDRKIWFTHHLNAPEPEPIPSNLLGLRLSGQGALAAQLSFGESTSSLVDEEMEDSFASSDAETMHTSSMQDVFDTSSDTETIKGSTASFASPMSLDPRDISTHPCITLHSSGSHSRSRSSTPTQATETHLQAENTDDAECIDVATMLLAGVESESDDGDDGEDEAEEEVTRRPRTTQHRCESHISKVVFDNPNFSIAGITRRCVSSPTRSLSPFPSPIPGRRPPRRTPHRHTHSN